MIVQITIATIKDVIHVSKPTSDLGSGAGTDRLADVVYLYSVLVGSLIQIPMYIEPECALPSLGTVNGASR